MRLSLAFLSAATTAHAFSSSTSSPPPPHAAFAPRRRRSAATRLFIASWGKEMPEIRSAEDRENLNPEANVQNYLAPPEPVQARAEGLTGTALVSGLVKTTERSDQFLFDMLHNEESAFDFDTIVAFVDDTKFAKRRLISRSSRYTGLLDKLDFCQAAEPGALPTAAQLDEIRPASWVAVVDSGDVLARVAEIARIAQASASVVNVAILVTGANDLDVAASQRALDALKAGSTKFTLVAVGKLQEHDEGKVPYTYAEFGTQEGVLDATQVFSRNEAIRLTTECLQLECGVNRALVFTELDPASNATEAKLVKGLREAGYDRPQEIDHMVRLGPKAYQEAIDSFYERHPHMAPGEVVSDAWWLHPKFLERTGETEEEPHVVEARKNPNYGKTVQELEEEKYQELLEDICKDWIDREYYKARVAGVITSKVSKEEFGESIRDKAMEVAKAKAQELKENDPEERRKKMARVALERAKDELRDLIGDEIDDYDFSEEDAFLESGGTLLSQDDDDSVDLLGQRDDDSTLFR